MSDVIRVRIEQIRVDHGRWPTREYLPPARLKSLKIDLAHNGLREPLLVCPTSNQTDRYDLIRGRRRLEAAIGLGWTEIEVRPRLVTPLEAAILVLAHEFERREPMTPLERGWGVVQTMDLRRKAGLSDSVRATAQALGMTKSTVQNACTVGRTFPRFLVVRTATRLDGELGNLLAIDQAPLLLIAREPCDTTRLWQVAATAHLEGKSALEAVEKALGKRRKPRCGLRETGDGRLKLRMDVPVHQMTPDMAGELARQFRAQAQRLDAISDKRPIGVQTVQGLVRLVAEMWNVLSHEIRRFLRAVARSGSKLTGLWGGQRET